MRGEHIVEVVTDDPRLEADELFLLNSTSGTTGLPKCVTHHQARWFHFHDLAVEAADLGADVPVCVHARTMHMAGVGDRLMSAPQLPGAALVLVCPQIPVDTADVYSRWLRNADSPALPLDSAVRDVQSLADFLQAHRNDLTTPAKTIAPQIADVVQALADKPGCLLARMSGSGPACFGLFGDAGDAAEALARISSTRPEWWAVVTQLEAGEVLA